MGIKKQPDSINETRAVVKNVEQNRTTSLIWSADHAPNPLTRVGSLSCVEHCGDILIKGAAAGGQTRWGRRPERVGAKNAFVTFAGYSLPRSDLVSRALSRAPAYTLSPGSTAGALFCGGRRRRYHEPQMTCRSPRAPSARARTRKALHLRHMQHIRDSADLCACRVALCFAGVSGDRRRRRHP